MKLFLGADGCPASLHLALHCSALVLVLLPAAPGAAKNLWLIAEDPQTGFAIYRSGKPSAADMREFCELGLSEGYVLSGNADEYEEAHADACPTLEVVYDVGQATRCPLTSEFLDRFDAWVEEARSAGKKIYFRCDCGCHRTGRLAGYYQIKHNGKSFEEARDLMMQRGKYMWWPKFWKLTPQLQALADHAEGRECSLEGTDRKYCVDSEFASSAECPQLVP